MKSTASDYYTDPIVYKEGFFKDRQEEQAYIARIAEQVEQQKARLARKAKKTELSEVKAIATPGSPKQQITQKRLGSAGSTKCN